MDLCGGGWTDAIVLYDRDAGRWFLSRFATADTSSRPFKNWYQCFAISKTPDPTGQYYRYAFLIDATEFNDYPKHGIWPDAYYMTADRDKIFPGKGNFVAAFVRGKMLQGQTANSVIFKIDNNGHRAGMLPADWDGHTSRPAGSANYLVRTLDPNLGWPSLGLEVWALQVDWVAVTASLTLLTTLSPTPNCGVPNGTTIGNTASASAAAAKAFADANGGTPPAGYVVVCDGPVVGPKQ